MHFRQAQPSPTNSRALLCSPGHPPWRSLQRRETCSTPGARTSNAPLTQVPPLCAPSRNLLAAEVSMFLLASEMGTVQGLGSRLCPHRHDKLLVGHRLVWRWRRTQARGLSALTPMPTIYSSGYPLRFGACEPSVKNVQCMHSTALGGTAESSVSVELGAIKCHRFDPCTSRGAHALNSPPIIGTATHSHTGFGRKHCKRYIGSVWHQGRI
jgi:hypothetical protein